MAKGDSMANQTDPSSPSSATTARSRRGARVPIDLDLIGAVAFTAFGVVWALFGLL